MLLILRDFFPTRVWVDCSSVWFSRRKTYNLNHLILKQVNYIVYEKVHLKLHTFSVLGTITGFSFSLERATRKKSHFSVTPQLSLISTVSVDQSYGFFRLGNHPLKIALVLGVAGWGGKQREIFRAIELSWVGG